MSQHSGETVSRTVTGEGGLPQVGASYPRGLGR